MVMGERAVAPCSDYSEQRFDPLAFKAVPDNRADLGSTYRVATASVNAILRRLLMLEREGGKKFFGEPALQLDDFMQTGRDGRGNADRHRLEAVAEGRHRLLFF